MVDALEITDYRPTWKRLVKETHNIQNGEITGKSITFPTSSNLRTNRPETKNIFKSTNISS
jgi:hypothetical protein